MGRSAVCGFFDRISRAESCGGELRRVGQVGAAGKEIRGLVCRSVGGRVGMQTGQSSLRRCRASGIRMDHRIDRSMMSDRQ